MYEGEPGVSSLVRPLPRVARPTYGRNLLLTLHPVLLGRPIVFTQAEPWNIIAPVFPADEPQVHFVYGMEHEQVRDTTASLGVGSAVFGIGGGQALDHAKYVAWTRQMPLVLVPSILSVDAAFTKAIGVREGARVRYVGEVFLDRLLVDFGILETAPPLLNRAGAGDILSIYTALWDWQESSRRTGEPCDRDIVRESKALLDRLFANTEALADGTEDGFRELCELYVGEVRLCEITGNSRPEEGSEHYLAYCLEARTRRQFVHGQLVGLCVLLAAAFQGQELKHVARFLSKLRLDCSPSAVGTNEAELQDTLRAMEQYVRQEPQLLPGIFHFKTGISPGDTARIMREVLDALEDA